MKILLTIAVWLMSGLVAAGQSTVTLSWTDTLNPPGTTYDIYRADGPCGEAAFNVIAVGLTAFTYQDVNVTSGTYCYVATAIYNQVESAFSGTVQPNIPPFAPAGLTYTVP